VSLPRGIGDPKELVQKMAARGLVKFPKPSAVALEVACAEMAKLKAQPGYQAARVVDPSAPLAERSVKQKAFPNKPRP